MNRLAASPAACAAELGYTFAGRTAASLVEVTFQLSAGSLCVVAGATGSGKSTLLRCLAGLIPHHSAGTMQGRLEVLGLDTRSQPPERWAGRVGVLLQSPDDQFCTTTVESEIAFGMENLALPEDEIARRLDGVLERYGFAARRYDDSRRLSGGQKQRLLLACLMALEARLLLLDEPLSQLDSAAASDLLDELQRLVRSGMTVIVAEHRLDELLPRADHLLLLDSGRLVADVAQPGNDSAVTAAALEAAGLAPPELWQLLDPRSAVQQQSPPAAAPALPRTAPDMPALLTVRNLAIGYDRGPSTVIDGLCLDVWPGERVALVGRNGAGKSTLLAAMAGCLSPRAGTLRFTAPSGQQDSRPHAGLVLQNPDLMLYTHSVREELQSGPRNLRGPHEQLARAVELAATFGITARLDEPPQSLSQGQRLRVAVAATVAMAPRLLLLDEPTTGQDTPEVDRLLSALAELLRTGDWIEGLLFATHDLRCITRFASRVLVLDNGRLIADVSPADLVDDAALLAQAGMRLTPLLEFRRQRQLRALDLPGLAAECRRGPSNWGADS